MSPIQELDSHQSTITSTTPGAAALAQAVLSPTFTSAGLGHATVLTTTQPATLAAVSPVALTTVSMSQPLLSTLGINSVSSAPHTPVACLLYTSRCV